MLSKVADVVRSGAPEGQRNERAFWIACQLRDDRYTVSDARHVMHRFGAHCTPPLPEREAEAALQQAYKEPPREQAIERQGDKAAELIGWNETFTAAGEGSGWQQEGDILRYVQALFRDGENVCICPTLQGQGISRPATELINAIKTQGIAAIGDYEREKGCWVIHNPLDGKGRKDANVTDYRHVLVECDDLDIPAEQQLAIIEEIQLPCAAIVDAGNKSIHAIVRIDAGSNRDLFKERVEKLYGVLEARGYIVDRMCRNEARLSRLPGVWRGERRQWLIRTNCGCHSWGEWLDHIEGVKRVQHHIIDLAAADISIEDDSLIRPRFLTQEGSWLLVASSGIGKSSLTMQAAMRFGLGLDVFGLVPARPLRSLIVQAENCRLDLAEQVQGIRDGEGFDERDMAELDRAVTIISEDVKCGEEFADWLDRTISAHMPVDLVWIDPLLAYLGTGMNDQEGVTKFLRNHLNPVIHRHKVAVVVLHHTGKTRKKAQDDDYDLSYVGAGTSELTNWARAVSVAEKIGDNPVTVNLQHVKRGGRLPVKSAEIQHAEGRIHWVQVRDLSPDELAIAHVTLRSMPPLFDRRSKTAADSIWAWGYRELGLTPSQSDRCMEAAKKAAIRKQQGAALVRRTDPESGSHQYVGVGWEGRK